MKKSLWDVLTNIKTWLCWNFPIITTRNKRFEIINSAAEEILAIERKSTWSAINPVIHDLERLRANTWDQDRITEIQNWLDENFNPNKEKA